jgi:putative ABC transport system permease protein
VYDPNRTADAFNIVLLNPHDIDVVRAIPGIRAVEPQYLPQVEYITAGGEKLVLTVTQSVDGFSVTMAAGRLAADADGTGISIPMRYVEPLGFASPQDAVGQVVHIGFQDAIGTIQERTLTILGVQERSLLGNAQAVISAHMAEELFREQTSGNARTADRYQVLFARYDTSLNANEVDELKKRLADAGYGANTLADQIGIVSQVIDAVLVVLNGFGIIALLAATFGIVNTLLMAVNERTSEIGLMKALGADRRTIFTIFAAEAVSIGFWGGLLGIGVSMGIGAIANHLAADTFLNDLVGLQILSFPFFPSLFTLLGVMVLAFLAGALPALKASKMDPISALRYE